MSTNDTEIEFHQLDLRYEGLRVRRPEREKRLLSSLAERGQQVAIVVVRMQDEPNRYLVIDGYKRIRALRKLGRDTVHATVWNMTETEALILDRSLRTAEGETALEQAWLLSELHSSMEMSLDDLALRFDRSKSWVSRRLALVCELPLSVQHYVRLGKIGAHAAMKYLVPIARTNKSSCERLAEEISSAPTKSDCFMTPGVKVPSMCKAALSTVQNCFYESGVRSPKTIRKAWMQAKNCCAIWTWSEASPGGRHGNGKKPPEL
jgi:ParB family chromosome partitioning protein